MQPRTIIQDPASTSDYSTGRFGATVDRIILHTEDGFEAGTDAWFANPSSHVSAHYSIGLDGAIRQHVSEGDTAWAAGNWGYNIRSVDIEFEDSRNPDGVIRTQAQLDSGAWLVADIGRRHGIALDRSHVIGHREVPNSDHPGCPGNLPMDQIVASSVAALGGTTAPVVAPAAASVPGVSPWGPNKVRVTVDILRVHNSPSTGDAGNFGNTKDGMLHLDNLADVNGWVRGEVVTQNGVTSDLWCHTTSGHYFWAYDTDFVAATGLPLLAAPPAPAAPTPAAPSYNFTAAPTTLSVAADIGANLRSEPTTAGNVVGTAEKDAPLQAIGFVDNGGDVAGNTKWWKIDETTFVSDAVVAVQAVPTPPAAPAPAPTPDVTPAATPAPTPDPVVTPVAPAPTAPGVGPASDITAPQPPAPAVDASSKMSLRDYLVAVIAWVAGPILRRIKH